MLKTMGSSNKPASDRNNSSRSNSGRNNNKKLVFKKNNSNNEVNKFGVGDDGVGYAKKLGKLKNQKLSKF